MGLTNNANEAAVIESVLVMYKFNYTKAYRLRSVTSESTLVLQTSVSQIILTFSVRSPWVFLINSETS